MKKVKLLLVFAIVIVMMAAVFSGCGDNSSGDAGDGGGNTTTSGDSGSSGGGASADKITLQFYSWCMTQEWLDAMMEAALYPDHPEIYVELIEVYSPEEYIQGQKMHLLNGTIDMTAARPESVVEYYEAGYMMDLTGQPFMDRFTSEQLKNITFDGKVWGIPGTVDYVGVYYNKTMFEENGWGVPGTWDEFVALLDTIKDSGVVKAPMTNGGRELWVMIMDTAPFFHGIQVDDPDVYQKINRGEAKWTDDNMLKMFTDIDNFYKAGYIHPDLVSLSMDDAHSLFLNKEETALIIQGNFFGQWFMDYGAEFEVGVFAMPYPGLDNPADQVIPLLIADHNFIAASTKYPEECLLVLDAFCSPEASIVRSEMQGCITTSPAPGAKVNDYLKLFLPLLEYPSEPFFWCEYNPAVSTLLNKNMQEMFMGMMTPQEMVESLQAEQDRS